MDRFYIILIVFTLSCIQISRSISQEQFFPIFRDFWQKDVISKRQSGNDTVEQCQVQMQAFLNEFPETWTLEVADAWGKIPSGILSGNLYDFGSFDQCLNIEHKINNANIFQGQYCLALIKMDQANTANLQHSLEMKKKLIESFEPNSANMTRAGAPVASSVSIKIGICIPKSCSPEYVSSMIKDALNEYIPGNVDVNVSPNACNVKEEERVYSGFDIFAIAFFSWIAFMMLLSTAYDLIMKKILRKNVNPNLLAFSVYTNSEKIFACKRSTSANVMDCLNGIRALSIVWVVFGHVYISFMFSPITNILVIQKWLKNMYSMVLMGATVSVDSFFVLSGLLLTWSVFKELDKTNGRLNILMMYVHRYLRLTPPLAAAVLFQVTLMKYMANGPNWHTNDMNIEFCERNWPYLLLYVQNYVNPREICFGQSWYLSVDMQLFILSPIILYPLWRWRNKVIWLLPILAALSVGCVFGTFMFNDAWIGPNGMPDTVTRMAKTYFPTHTRYGTWLVGVILGLWLYDLKGKIVILPKSILTIGWTLSLATIFANVFAIYPMYQENNHTTVLEYALQESLSRIGWSIALAWIIFACVIGYGGPINWLLSLPQWQPLCRLSYSLYIVHFPFQMAAAAAIKVPLYFSDFAAIHKFWGDFALSLCIALIWSLAFESPIVTLEKFIFGRKKKSEPIINGDHKQ